MGFTFDIVPPKVVDDEVVSSSAIRQAVAEGNIVRVNKFLGHPFSLEGRVISGQERGRFLGLPTANLSLDVEQALPADGVYATWAYPDRSRHPSVTNIGVRPTFGGGERLVEVFILDFHGNLYGGELKIELVQRLRDEIRFNTPEDLKAQVDKDTEKARKILKKAE
jgi:riboflavin kinase/FMN adenylyltransferase